ncbi:Diphthamide biosynthesis protein 3 [Xylographa trunciseda]|nr:Diphthamide biosynthesis protein 3 [Xylographa trunciseda]
MPASPTSLSPESIAVGRLVFPDYNSSSLADDKTWHKKVYLYVGKHQRLTGEVKKLPKPLAVVRRKLREQGHQRQEQEDELEVVEIVSWKVVFSNRPEPVGEMEDAGPAKMTSIYDEIEIEDMTYDTALQIYHYPCPCGDRFEIGIAELRDGEDIAVCPSCSLMIRVVFEVDDLPKLEDEGDAQLVQQVETPA